jgi:hypothetical protein
MAETTHPQYHLSPAESAAWRRNVVDMLLLHQQLAEVHRQDGFGLGPQVTILHPDGTRALRLALDQAPASLPAAPAHVQTQARPVAQSLDRSSGEGGGRANTPALRYHLSPTESTVWQQGGQPALLLQQQLAETHRQGSLGLAPTLEVLHPDGTLAAQYTIQTPAQGPSPSPVEQAPSPSQVQVPSPARDLGRAEGTLLETSTITAYRMSANESAAWSRGEHEARMVEANIGDALKDVTTSQPVAVLLDDGRAVYTHGGTMLQTMSEAISLLRDRLSALASGVQVHMDFSVQLGTPRGTVQDAVGALQQRANQLTQPAPQRAQSQGMSY